MRLLTWLPSAAGLVSIREVMRGLRDWTPFCLPAAYVLFVIGPTATAPLTLWDHWIAFALGADRQITAESALEQTCTAIIEDPGRFRPLYWGLYFSETYLWGDWAPGWRLTRLALALLSGALIYGNARHWLRPWQSAVVALAFFSGSQCEAWLRLGLQEAYGMPLVLGGFAWITARLAAERALPSELLPGQLLLLAAGLVKEPLIPITAAVLVFVYLILPRFRGPIAGRLTVLRGWQVVALAVPVLGVLLELSWTAAAYIGHGHIYGQSTTLAAVAATAVDSLATFTRDTWFPVPVLLAVAAWALCPGFAPDFRYRRLAMLAGLVLLDLVMLLVPQWLAYGAMGKMEYRYLMPANLAVVVVLGLAFSFLSGALQRLSSPVRVGVLGLALSAPVFAAIVQAPQTRDVAMQTRDGGRAFQADLDRIVQFSYDCPECPIVFIAPGLIFAFEQTIAVQRFLEPRLPPGRNPFLVVEEPREFASRFERDLFDGLVRNSREGGKGFASLQELPTGARAWIEVRFKPASLYLGDPFSVISVAVRK